MARFRPWPFDDEDRPSGSVQPLSQADLQAILAHFNSDPDELLAGTGADRPAEAVPVRASVGRPGGSAEAQWQRLRAAEWAAWARTCPGGSPPPWASGPVGESLAASWPPARDDRCRGRDHRGRLGAAVPAQPRSGRLAARGRGGAMHRPPAGSAGAARLGGPARPGPAWQPGQPRPPGHRPGWVFVIDSKQYRGQLQLDPTGRLWHGRFPLAPALRAVSFEADQAALVLTDPDVVVVPVMAIHGTQVPWGKVVMDGVPVVPARRLPSMLRELPAVLGPERVAVLADQARVRFHAAA
jgi:hypothetical protein